MSSINFIERTFGDLENNLLPDVNDPYNIMASLGPKMREAVLHNPSGFSEDEVCQILALDGDIVVGVCNALSSRLRIRNESVLCQIGNNLYSHEDYRKDNIGGFIFHKYVSMSRGKVFLAAGLSQIAVPLHKALRYSVFEFPRLIYLRKSKSVIQTLLRSEKWWTRPIILTIDFILQIHRSLLKLWLSSHLKEFVVEEVKETPLEVEQIVNEDAHPFMELHDKAWFDWNLNNCISEDPRTIKRLFVIKKDGVIEAFFLNKQEFFEHASGRGFKNVYLGSVMEWGIKEESKLEEKDIASLSCFFFDNSIDGVQFATVNKKVEKKLKHRLFIKVGNANYAVRPADLKDSEMRDINNWRIRLGGCDTILN